MKNRNHLLQSILLPLFVVVLVASALYSYTSITMMAFGVLSTQSSSTTTNATLNQVTMLNNKGNALLSVGLGNYTQAIMYFDKALAIDPKNVAALTNKGNALGGLGNYTQAITYYDKALAIDPRYVLAIIGKGYALDGLGNHAKAITYYDKALAIDPRYIADLTNKGNFLNSLGNYRLAITYFDKALAINPKNIAALTGKKQALAALNQPK